ncbi:methylaspartate mutase accessory protein GlmL [Clostridium algidicarnis]|uniref:methylaspartate mutase accessory protein GlmL n=1 Tax=Clostridium algidicarnis TaxID=37659 RepID=UPI001C0BD04F|nr:methylaspartate mutase accessory protein GlmL [Clostridium algidicarnis]MBU3196806.1 glutamate mutase L [Clostridium algidicarnis]MBU3210120.1 glutamate mutase L [Clostridium algidicarnis]MBU3227875.1 glutamate mutase L [Clostridium algidicarnis]MBU3251625.1 glutamate mutase L [Clostridium algidicarnis]
MDAYLLIDFGSTYTKLTAIDIKNEEILATSKDITTIEDDIMIGFNKAYDKLLKDLQGKEVNFVRRLACSSAAGGLKMIAIGLVPELTAEAAKRAALGAGARVLKTYSYELTNIEMKEIKKSDIDIILLAGGTDGGNKECIIHNAKMIVKHEINIPVVVAGNKGANDDISELFDEAKTPYFITENVMPKLNSLNVEPAREEIRKIFMNRIVDAKGLTNAEEYVNGILMPTPAAVLKAARVLSEGSDKEEGIGEIVVIDIGGATTDVHSIADGEPTKAGVTLRGLEEPFAKRTVEGDLGMRYSALSLWEAAGTRKIKKVLKNKDLDVEENCRLRSKDIMMVPKTEDEVDFDESMARIATELAMERHCGYVEPVYSPLGVVYTQYGKDLMEVKYMIGTGGVLVHSKDPGNILQSGTFSKENLNSLRPQRSKLLLDKTYILSSMGLLAEELPDLAVRIMKKYLVEIDYKKDEENDYIDEKKIELFKQQFKDAQSFDNHCNGEF